MKALSGQLSNQIKVLIQRMRLRGYTPWKILLHPGMRWVLREECRHLTIYRTHDQGDTYAGLPIVCDTSVNEPIIMIDPEYRDTPLEKAQSTWGKRGSYVSR